MNPVASWFCKIFLKPIVDWLLIKEVRGLKNIPKSPFILVSNHTSYLDVIVDGYLCVPRRFHFIGQIDGWKGIMKWLIRTLYFVSGVIPLDRQSDESRENALKEAIRVLKKGNILVLYPEGRRSANGELQEGKLGAAKIFLKTRVPILPVGLKGTFELFPPQGKLKIKRIVEIDIGQPLFFNEEFNLAQNLVEELRSSPASAKSSASGNSPEYQQILGKITEKIMEKIEQLTV